MKIITVTDLAKAWKCTRQNVHAHIKNKRIVPAGIVGVSGKHYWMEMPKLIKGKPGKKPALKII